jgi:threonine/homoserine/homoserine lactone efflux protein
MNLNFTIFLFFGVLAASMFDTLVEGVLDLILDEWSPMERFWVLVTGSLISTAVVVALRVVLTAKEMVTTKFRAAVIASAALAAIFLDDTIILAGGIWMAHWRQKDKLVLDIGVFLGTALLAYIFYDNWKHQRTIMEEKKEKKENPTTLL